nr:endogenous Bornavirus-like nucleoprotein 1 [Macaca nemestrina]
MRTAGAAGGRTQKGDAKSRVVPEMPSLLPGLRGRGLLTSFVVAPPRLSTRFGSRLVLPVCNRGSESGHRNQSETIASATKTIVHHGGTHGYVSSEPLSAIPFTGQQSFEPSGKFGQYPSDADEPHSGIGEVEDTEQLNQCLIQHFHLIKTSLTFLWFLFHGIHENLLTVGVSKESYPVTSFGGKNKTKMLYGQSHKGKDLQFTSLQLLSVLYCCDLLIGIGIVVGVK